MRQERVEILEELATKYGGMMTQKDVAEAIGCVSTGTISSIIEGLPAYEINGRRRWRTSDIAKRIASMEVDNGIY